MTDVPMPKLDGLALMARLREQRPALPVVIMTGHLLTSMVVIEPFEAKTTVFIKPVPTAQLLDAVRASLPADRTESRSGSDMGGFDMSEAPSSH